MSAPPLRDPLALDASLHLLADHLADALQLEELEPCLLHVGQPDEAGFDLGVAPLDGRHPTDDLLGLTAPEHWHAVGLATHGWAYHVADRTDPDRRRHRVHVVTLVSRTGEHAHRTRVDGRPDLEDQLTGDTPSGEQIDLLRLALGLPTEPPPCPSSVYWSIDWLAALAAAEPAPATVVDAVATHAAMRLLAHGPGTGPADIPDVLAAFHRVVTWPRMRSMAAEGRFTLPELEPGDADWLDDGAFARFVLSRCPSLNVLRARLDSHIAPVVADAVCDLLDELDVPDAAWPDLLGRSDPTR